MFPTSSTDQFASESGPLSSGWEDTSIPGDQTAYALEVSGHNLAPVYREGDVLIVSPKARISAGDRLVVRTSAGELLARELIGETGDAVELRPLTPGQPDQVLRRSEIDFMHRVMWASS